MGAKQNFNLGGINSHFNGLKDAGNMSPTQLALTYSKEQLQHMAQMGVINPTNAVIAGMNIDRISNTNAPPTSTVSQNTFAPQQPQQGQLPQQPQQPPQGQPPQQGGIMSIPRPGQKYQHGGVVAFSNRGEVKAPIYDEDAEFAALKKVIAGHSVSERERGIDSSPNITDENLQPINDYTPTISPSKDPRLLREIYGKGGEPSAVGRPGVTSLVPQRPVQSARPGAGAGAPPAQLAQLAQPNPDYEAFMKTLKNPNLSSVYKDIPDEKDNDLNRALIRGGAAMMANRDPAIGSGLQGFFQGVGKGATEGLTGYEQSREKSKKRSDDLQKNRAEEAFRNETVRQNAAGHGATAILQKQAEENKIPAAALLAQNEEKRARIVASGNMSLVEAWDRAKTPEEQAKVMKLVAGMYPRTATTKDWNLDQMLNTEKLFETRLANDPSLYTLTPEKQQIERVKFMRTHGYSDYGSNVGGGGGGGGYQPTKEQLAALNRNLLQK